MRVGLRLIKSSLNGMKRKKRRDYSIYGTIKLRSFTRFTQQLQYGSYSYLNFSNLLF